MLNETPRECAKRIYSQPGDWQGKVLRALVLTLLDELNDLRTRIREQDAVVAGATNLTTLKNAWGLLSSMPDRTAIQARNAIEAKLDDEGDVT